MAWSDKRLARRVSRVCRSRSPAMESATSMPASIKGMTTHRLRAAADSTHNLPHWMGKNTPKIATMTSRPSIPERFPTWNCRISFHSFQTMIDTSGSMGLLLHQFQEHLFKIGSIFVDLLHLCARVDQRTDQRRGFGVLRQRDIQAAALPRSRSHHRMRAQLLQDGFGKTVAGNDQAGGILAP